MFVQNIYSNSYLRVILDIYIWSFFTYIYLITKIYQLRLMYNFWFFYNLIRFQFGIHHISLKVLAKI